MVIRFQILVGPNFIIKVFCTSSEPKRKLLEHFAVSEGEVLQPTDHLDALLVVSLDFGKFVP